nr:olfactory receptor 52R1-like [Pelodiscus sinensis]|eukprot:XP_025037320.1 olfactory receptor 52R1-like [Pelodiscus sinensis]
MESPKGNLKPRSQSPFGGHLGVEKTQGSVLQSLSSGSQESIQRVHETLFGLTVVHHLLSSMSDSNTTHFSNPSNFILLGFPGLETAYAWISIPFCSTYTISVLGNFTILFIVKRELSLHEPMYYFLCMLAVTDLVLSTSTLPKTLSIFWFNSREIDFSACLTQMFFIHCFLAIESGIFVAMALDRYVAICHPLRHSTILTNSVVAKIGLAVLLRGGMLTLPFTYIGRSRWPYCMTNIIAHSHCEYIAVVRLACGDTRISSYYGLFVVFFVTGLFSFLTQRFGQNVALHFRILIGNVYLLVPPMLNPIIYGVKTRQIRDRLLQLFSCKGS